VIVRADEVAAALDLSSEKKSHQIGHTTRERTKKVVRSPASVSFFSAGFPKSPPIVEALVAVEVPAAAPSFFSPSLVRPNKPAVVAGVASFFSSGLVTSLFAVVAPNSPPPVVPPVPPKDKPLVVGGTGVDVPDVSGFLTPNKPPPNACVVVVEVDVEAVALSAGLGGSPKNPPVVGMVGVADESPAGLGGPPKNPPVVLVLGGPPNRPPDVAAEHDQHRGSKGQYFHIYLVSEHPCSPRVLVRRTILRQRQGWGQGSWSRFLQFLK